MISFHPALPALILSFVLPVSLPGLHQIPIVPSHHPHRVIVKPRNDVDPSLLNSLHQSLDARVLRILENQGNVMTVLLPERVSVPEAVAVYRRSPRVQFAEPDFPVSAATTLPNDPWFQNGTLWALNNFGQNGGLTDADIDAPHAWDVSRSAESVLVAIIDSGIRATHLDLAANLWTHPSHGFHGTNAIAGSHDLTDDHGHGTHLAGIIGAVGDNERGVVGVAWQTRLMSCKFLDAQGNGFNSDAAACIEFAREHGARILNLSWGGPMLSETLSNAIHAARSDGILFVASAGNNAWNIDQQPYYPAALPLDNLISVGASTRQDTVWIASNHGAVHVDLFAPGLDIHSTSHSGDNLYASLDGTSMATAYVTGALALLRERMPDAPYREVIERLFAGVDQRETFAGKCVTGGRINLRRTLDQPVLALVPQPCGTCPPDQQSFPWHLSVQGVPAHAYLLEASSDFNTWLPLQTNLLDPTGLWRFTDPDSTILPRRFYRAIPAP